MITFDRLQNASSVVIGQAKKKSNSILVYPLQSSTALSLAQQGISSFQKLVF